LNIRELYIDNTIYKLNACSVQRDLLVFFLFQFQYHPDMNKSPGAEEKFKEISAAYEVSSALWYLLNG
jgi:hypothetical protein